MTDLEDSLIEYAQMSGFDDVSGRLDCNESSFCRRVYRKIHENHYFIILIPRDFIEHRFYIRVVHLSELHALKIEQRVRIREFIEYFNVFKETKDPHADLLNMYFMDMHRKLNDYGKGIHLPKLER